MRLVVAVLLSLSGAALFAQSHSDPTMLHAASAFLASLDAGQRAKAVLPFNSEERFHWFYVPVARKGIPLKELNAAQKQAALALLRAGLSEKGYSKAETIRK